MTFTTANVSQTIKTIQIERTDYYNELLIDIGMIPIVINDGIIEGTSEHQETLIEYTTNILNAWSNDNSDIIVEIGNSANAISGMSSMQWVLYMASWVLKHNKRFDDSHDLYSKLVYGWDGIGKWRP